MPHRLHHHVASTYSQKALLAHYEKGVDFTPVQVNLFDPAARAEYKKLYPLGKIPLLTGDDLFIPESTIIVEYLENEYPDSGTRLIPQDKTAARRARFKDRMADLYLNEPVSTLFFQSQKPADQRNAPAEAKARETLDIVYSFIDQDLQTNPFLSGQAYGIADCAAFGPLFYAQKLHPWAGHKHIAAYFGRVVERASAKRLLAELLPVLEAFGKK